MEGTRITRDEDWLMFHMSDPVAIAPGARSEPPVDERLLDEDQSRAVLAYLRRTRAGAVAPPIEPGTAGVTRAIGTRCVACHVFDGDGAKVGPDLTHIGARRDAAAIRRIVNDPIDEYGDSIMPAFGSRLSAADIAAIADYLAARK